MSIMELSKLFSDLLNHKVYALNFPEYTKGQFIKLEITSGIEEAGGVLDFNIQFMCKANHPASAESLAVEIMEKLDLKADVEFSEGKYQMIVIKASTPQPFFVGVSEKGEFVFSVGFRVLVAEI